MASNIIIKSISSYHPVNVVDNDFFLKHFSKQGKDVSPLLRSLGRDKRYISKDKSENSLTMGIVSAKKALQENSLKGKDMDMIIFSSGTPEYTSPASAIIIHKEIEGKSDTITYDINANCVGMVIAIDQVSNYMLSKPKIKYALVVGSEQMNRFSRSEDAITYANFGDASCAIILERVEDTHSGYVDSAYYTKSTSAYEIMLPSCGLSKLYEEQISDYDRRCMWEANANNGFSSTVDCINTLLKDNGLTKENISLYCFSQLSKSNLKIICDNLGEDFNKFHYIGDEYGYTGTSSPFITLELAIKSNKIHKGQYIVFWSIGAGSTACTMMFRL